MRGGKKKRTDTLLRKLSTGGETSKNWHQGAGEMVKKGTKERGSSRPQWGKTGSLAGRGPTRNLRSTASSGASPYKRNLVLDYQGTLIWR